jgi:hypothetical protein
MVHLQGELSFMGALALDLKEKLRGADEVATLIQQKFLTQPAASTGAIADSSKVDSDDDLTEGSVEQEVVLPQSVNAISTQTDDETSSSQLLGAHTVL